MPEVQPASSPSFRRPTHGTSFVPVFLSRVPLISFSRGLSNPRDSHFQEGLLPFLKTYPLVS